MIYKIIILTLVCTYVVCNDMKESTLPEVPEDGTCVEGQNYRLDCNTCHCFGNNQLGCTLKGCLPSGVL
ncbi:hypothetical protein HCN44_001290 [Aphidius gifuensis]|uniref:Pacifastin domain-containing protein n=1 Tax=Aphidius gifuensis TaxID=684658 RepID=A0A834XNE7_APHGI|nr:hypothetical protein HCN44_001290 [Aphidius gifuensis]